VLIPFNASIARRKPKRGIELATRREFVEKPQLEAGKPESGSVDDVPILRYIRQGRGTPSVHKRSHVGGTGVFRYASAETRSLTSLRRRDIAPFWLVFRARSKEKIKRNYTVATVQQLLKRNQTAMWTPPSDGLRHLWKFFVKGRRADLLRWLAEKIVWSGFGISRIRTGMGEKFNRHSPSLENKVADYCYRR
jgi:hypothetical protein